MRNCFEGYLTDGCKMCDFWRDGSDNIIGCECPFPIDHCSYFRKMMDKEKSENEQRKYDALLCELNKRKKELENQLNISVQNNIENEMRDRK